MAESISKKYSTHALDTVDVRKNDVLNCIKKLDKLNSPGYGFLKRFQPSVCVPCCCETAKSTGSLCPCPPERKKMAFSSLQREVNPDPAKPCLPECGQAPLCKCGEDCPSRASDFERSPERTFHVPGCPDGGSKFSIPVPRSPVAGAKACPYSPACCPIGDVCPFPVDTIYDANAPPLPKQGNRKCPLLPQAGTGTDCPLCSLKTPENQNCALPNDCTQSQNCPLLSCSLGPLKSVIFDGEDECPFCQKKCCPMILPGGPGCPLEKITNICNIKDKGGCCLSEKLPNINSRRNDENEESCPLGEFIANKLQPNGCPKSLAKNKPSATSSANACKCAGGLSTNSGNCSKSCAMTNFQPQQQCMCSDTKSPYGSQKTKTVPCLAGDLLDCPALRKAPLVSGNRALEYPENSPGSVHQGAQSTNVRDKPAANVFDLDENIKPKPKNCPIPDPVPCPLSTPKCPFSPPEPACPLLREVTCPLQKNLGAFGSDRKLSCPVETEPCDLFPKGHCPMEDMGVCECAYPVSPCMDPPILAEEGEAKDQYCARLDCCMGLPLPPIKPSDEFETDKWYAFRTLEPTDLITKHYLEILDIPPSPEFFVSVNESRKHPAWRILKSGEGYKQCKRVKDIIVDRGPTDTVATQFDKNDLPDDEEILIIEQNRKQAELKIKNIEKDSRAVDWVA